MRAAYVAPVTVPEYPDVAGAAVVFVAVGVGVAACVCTGVALEEAVALADAVAPLCGFAVALVVADFVGVAACVAAAVVTVPSADGVPREPDNELAEVVELNCGGVIAKTAPRPPTVPPAINNARFMR